MLKCDDQVVVYYRATTTNVKRSQSEPVAYVECRLVLPEAELVLEKDIAVRDLPDVDVHRGFTNGSGLEGFTEAGGLALWPLPVLAALVNVAGESTEND
jgi:hypothetical protein